MMKLNMNPKFASVNIASKTIYLGEERNENFLQELEQEVIKSPAIAKRLIRDMKKTQVLSLSLITILTPSPAIPPEIVQFLLVAMGIIAALGIAIAIIASMLSGIWKMVCKALGKKNSDDWTLDIYKGLAQVLLSPLVIALIVAIFTILFRNVPAFQPIKPAIEAFFHK